MAPFVSVEEPLGKDLLIKKGKSSGTRTVYNQSKDRKDKKTYDALEWIAAMGTHMPLRGEQM